LTIFPSQIKAANQLVREYKHLPNAFPSTADAWKVINRLDCFFLGPSFTDLRDQTRADLQTYCDFVETEVEKAQNIRLKIHVENKIAARQGVAANDWLDRLKGDHGKTLFLLIHDEAHWGIAQNSEINQFLQRVAEACSESKAKCAILLVSATLSVLSEVSEMKYGFPELRKVEWSRESMRETYRSIHDLIFVNDPVIGKIKDRRPTNDDANVGTISASAVVWKQYATRWSQIKFVLDQGRVPAPLRETDICGKILSHLVTSPTPVMATVRLKQILDQEELLRHLKDSGATKYFDLVVQPPPDPLQRSCLLVLVDKVGMGIRVPRQCLYWDVRCRYKNTATSNLARFVQDVGRCAGHHKPIATVFVGVEDWKQDIKTLHGLVRWQASLEEHQLVKKHPETDEGGVYTQLADRIVLLMAEPQMGKTGTILAFLHTLVLTCSKTRKNEQEMAEIAHLIGQLPAHLHPQIMDLLNSLNVPQ
jgi:hypothetical protein